MRDIIKVAAALIAIALAATACGGANGAANTTAPTTPPAPTATTAPSPAEKQEAATFLRLVAPYSAAIQKLDASKANPTTTTEIQAFLAPLVAASNTFAGAILRAGFTGKAATAAQTMAIGVEAVVADIQSVTKANWGSKKSLITHDETTVDNEENSLRAELGLAPAKS